MKPTISMIGEEIRSIRFEVTSSKPLLEYQAIVKDIPDSPSKQRWLSRPKVVTIKDGYAEVKHGE